MKQEEANVIELVDNYQGADSTGMLPVDSSIPIKHFHLRCDPFLDNVNPDFFFRTDAHEDAYIKMKRCVTDNISLGLTTAVSGTGEAFVGSFVQSPPECPRVHSSNYTCDANGYFSCPAPPPGDGHVRYDS